VKPRRLAPLPSLVLGAFLVPTAAARAGTVTDRYVLTAGTSAEQFALMGGVFLILGGTFVFAPQIVSGVNKFMAAVFRRPLKTKPPAETGPAVPPLPEAEPGAQAAPAPEQAPPEPPDDSEFAPPPEAPSDAISRLRQEISSSWQKSDEP
jgi:hypothetical protein